MDTDLQQEFQLDNLDKIDISMAVEQAFSLSISQKDIEEHFQTPTKIIDYICVQFGVKDKPSA